MKKNILFLHPNFPAQFKNIAKSFARAGYSTKFLCQTHYGRSVKGVERICLKGDLSYEFAESKKKDGIEKSKITARQFRSALIQLKKSGWYPDVTIAHSGWGCGIHIKEIFPYTQHLSYLEWWFGNEKNLLQLNNKNKKDFFNFKDVTFSKFWQRNQFIALELVNADKIICPSLWQQLQLPNLLRKNSLVIYDGLDQQLISSIQSTKSATPKITYGTRGMEPVRYFPEFINQLPKVLESHRNLTVEIGGEDNINYGGVVPHEGSWKKWAEKKLHKYIKNGQISFTGYMNYDQYIRWLKSSWLHIYLSRPYVISWSLMEVAACQTPLAINHNFPCLEACQGRNAWLIDDLDKDFLGDIFKKVIEKKKAPSVPRLNLAQQGHTSQAMCDMGQASFTDYSSSFQKWLDVSHIQLLTGR